MSGTKGMEKMKKLALILVFLTVFGIQSFANEETPYVIYDLDDYKIVCERVRVAVPYEYDGPVYSYRNYGVVDKAGNVVIQQKYQGILSPSEGLSAFSIDGEIGFFNENWEVAIEAKYDGMVSSPSEVFFSEGLCAVPKKNDDNYRLWGYIDREGNEITEFIYDHAEPFKNGVATVGIREDVYNYNTKMKYGKIDNMGNVIEPFKFGYALGMDYEYLWQEPIEIQLSQNLVELNGVRYKNSDIEYPFINYLGYAYMPLTYYGARMLGINCDWTESDGVMLSLGGVPSEDIKGNNGMIEGVCELANFYKGKLTINGKLYEYGDTAYPLIHYKNVVYIPVLWQKGMEELGIEYSFLGAEKLENSDRGMMVFKTK